MDEKYSEATLKRLRNLRMFRGKTDEDIIKYLESRPPKPKEEEKPKAPPKPKLPNENQDPEYNSQFIKKLKTLRDEYKVNMNDANDAESLRQLVRSILQLEVIDKKIRDFYQSGSTNTKALKDLGDYQRSLQMTVADLQKTLGISRQIRTEKIIDDAPKLVAELKRKARDLWERKTLSIRCPKDDIELARLWLNFPNLANEAAIELECWKCHEKILYTLK